MKSSTPCLLQPIKFGTDGWRAITADQFTFQNLERVTQAYCDHLHKVRKTDAALSVCVGFDNRFLADRFAMHAAKVLAGNGIKVELYDKPVHTPLVSFAVIKEKHCGGLMLTASHNPAEYSGFKIKEDWGGSAFEETTRSVEGLLDAKPVKLSEEAIASTGLQQLEKAYRQHIAALIDLERIKSASFDITIDSMYGTGSTLIQSFIEGKRTIARTIRAERDCLFGNIAPEPIDKNLQALKTEVQKRNSTIGLATDGDGDRLGAVNELGESMTMHEVGPLLLLHLARGRKQTGTVVSTVTQSVLMRRIAEASGLKYTETPVGFKYIAREMLSDDVLIGAEESGGIGIKGHIPERDGVFNGLLLLEALAFNKTSPTQYVQELHREFGTFYYDRQDLKVPSATGTQFLTALQTRPPTQLADTKVVELVTTDGVKIVLEDDSWLMFRQSGTEPVLRVYAEATSKQKTADLLKHAHELLAMTNH